MRLLFSNKLNAPDKRKNQYFRFLNMIVVLYLQNYKNRLLLRNTAARTTTINVVVFKKGFGNYFFEHSANEMLL